jgi:hypothetical protein
MIASYTSPTATTGGNDAGTNGGTAVYAQEANNYDSYDPIDDDWVEDFMLYPDTPPPPGVILRLDPPKGRLSSFLHNQFFNLPRKLQSGRR